MKKTLTLTLSVITICILYLAAFPAKAIDKDWTFDPKTSSLIPKYLGKVKVLKGTAVIGDRELKKGSQIYNGELVQTGEKSLMVIEMIDLTIVTLGPLSDFSVEGWSYRTKTDRNAVFNVAKGQWRALIKSKSKDDDQIKIKTALISMGVRGTELLVNVAKIGDREINQIALLEGKIHLEGELPPNMKQDLVAGDYAHIEKNANAKNSQNIKEKILSPDEMKSYQQFIAPEVLRLLEPVAQDVSKDNSDSKKTSEASPQSAVVTDSVKAVTPKSLEENLKILNTTREKNLKTK